MKLKTLPQLACIALALSGCGNDPKSTNLASISAQIGGILNKSKQDAPPTADQIRASITPELRAQFGNAPLMIGTLEQRELSSLLIGVGLNNGTRTFTTPDGITVSLAAGLLVATRGLGWDLMVADVSQSKAALHGQAASAALRTHRYLDGEDQVVTLSFRCQMTGMGTAQLRERCTGDGHEFENSYVLGPGGAVHQSRQWIGPEHGYILLQDAGQ